MIIAIIFFLAISTTVVLGIATPILKHIKNGQEREWSKKSFFLAQSAIEDVVYRLRSAKQLSSPEVLTLNGGTVTTTIANTVQGKQIIATASVNGDVRKIEADVVLGDGISFRYGVQAGNGGFDLQNSASLTGNIYSAGPVTGSNNYIYGDAVSAYSTGLISGIHATGTAYAHTIQNSTIDHDAYYVTKTNTTVSGTSHPNSTDLGAEDLPISDDQIAEWEGYAVAGGTINSPCPYTINSNVSLGPIKINCDLVIRGVGTIVTITGHVWVNGNITTQNTPTIKISPTLGNQNVAIIADKPTASTTAGTISLQNNTTFQGSGDAKSFVFMISQNRSAQVGGSTDAISITQGTGALIVYAGHGKITLGNSISVKEVTGYKIVVQNAANIVYDLGLPSIIFNSGPAGGYNISLWKEIQ
jgi:hypothetical protein